MAGEGGGEERGGVAGWRGGQCSFTNETPFFIVLM
jgi:hypothetical protein